MNLRERSTPPATPFFSLRGGPVRGYMSGCFDKRFLRSKAGKAGLGTILFLFCSLLGLGGAAFVFSKSTPVYQSDAKLLKEFTRNEAKLEIARSDGTLTPRNIPNISYIQKPSRPVKTHEPRTIRRVLGLAAGGPLLGLILAFGCRLGRRLPIRSAIPAAT